MTLDVARLRRDTPACETRLHFNNAGAALMPNAPLAVAFLLVERFAAEHDLVLVTIADLIRYRRHREKLVRRVSEARIPTRYGDFTAHVFK